MKMFLALCWLDVQLWIGRRRLRRAQHELECAVRRRTMELLTRSRVISFL